MSNTLNEDMMVKLAAQFDTLPDLLRVATDQYVPQEESPAFYKGYINAVMMLARNDAEAAINTLRLHLLRSKREYVLHEAVTEAREVAFPSPGVLYNVVSGEDAGVWFAKAL